MKLDVYHNSIIFTSVSEEIKPLWRLSHEWLKVNKADYKELGNMYQSVHDLRSCLFDLLSYYEDGITPYAFDHIQMIVHTDTVSIEFPDPSRDLEILVFVFSSILSQHVLSPAFERLVCGFRNAMKDLDTYQKTGYLPL